MRQYWVMKTYAQWWDVFRLNNMIGIDEQGVTQPYSSLTDQQIQQMISAGSGYTEAKDRSFREFCTWMNTGDMVIIGVGQTTKFNVAGIVEIRGNYVYDPSQTPRHIRDVKVMKDLAKPLPMLRFARSSRLELVHESDFLEALVDLIP